MITISSYLQQGRHTLRRICLDPRLHLWAKGTGQLLSGFAMSAASLGNHLQPLSMALVLSGCGSAAGMTALGAGIGYWAFWGDVGLAGVGWVVPALLCALMVGHMELTKWLLPSVGALIVAAGGVVCQFSGGYTPTVPMYLLQVGLGFGSTMLFCAVRKGRDAIARWLAWGCVVLALAQLAPVRWLNLGFVAAGMLGSGAAFPAVAVAGLALDLAQVTAVPMTAVLCTGYFLRLLPWNRRWMI